MNGFTSNAVWILQQNYKAEVVLKEIRKPQLIQPVNDFLKKQLLMPYHIHELVSNQFEKKLVEHKVENKDQYPFFELCAAEVEEISDGNLKAVNLIHDAACGLYIIFVLTT